MSTDTIIEELNDYAAYHHLPLEIRRDFEPPEQDILRLHVAGRYAGSVYIPHDGSPHEVRSALLRYHWRASHIAPEDTTHYAKRLIRRAWGEWGGEVTP